MDDQSSFDGTAGGSMPDDQDRTGSGVETLLNPTASASRDQAFGFGDDAAAGNATGAAGEMDSLRPGDAAAEKPSGVVPFSYLMNARSDITKQTRSTAADSSGLTWSSSDATGALVSDDDPSELSTTDFNFAAYIRERAVVSQQYLREEEVKAPPEPEDPFNMDAAEEQLLKTPPTSFIVIGKPGSGKTTVAKLLAAWWRAVYVSADSLAEEVTESKSELGERLRSLLAAGASVPEQLAMAMVSERLRREDVQHYGYVLDGVPCESEKVVSQLDQLKMVLESPLPPTVIVHLKIPDEDLIARAMSYRFDDEKGRLYTMVYYTDKPKPPKKKKPPRIPVGDDEEEEEEEAEEEDQVVEEEEPEEEELEEEETPEEENEEAVEGEEEVEKPKPKKRPVNLLAPAPRAIRDRLLRVPEGDQTAFMVRLETYKSRLMLLLEDYMTHHSPEMLIELDATLPPRALLDSLKYRMAVLPLMRSLVPIRLLDEDGQPPQVTADDDPEQIGHVLAHTSPLCMRFKWKASDFGVTCPVSMKEGRVARGDPAFAVGFLNHFYVMSGAETLSLFMQSPRRYLAAPPQLPCRVVVIGPPSSGRSTLAAQIASCYSASVIDAAQASGPYLAEKRDQYREEKRAEKRQALAESIAERRKAEQEEAARLQKEEEERLQKEEEERRKLEGETPKKEEERGDAQEQDADGAAENGGEKADVDPPDAQSKDDGEDEPGQERKTSAASVDDQADDKGEIDPENDAGDQGEDEHAKPAGSSGSVRDGNEEEQTQPTGSSGTNVETSVTDAEKSSTAQSSTTDKPSDAENSPAVQSSQAVESSGSAGAAADGAPPGRDDSAPGADKASRSSSGTLPGSAGASGSSSRSLSGSAEPVQEEPDPEVEAALLEYADELEALVKDVQLEPADWLRLLQETVAETERRRQESCPSLPAHGGWVIDNMPTDPALWELMPQEKFEYDDLVCIWDDSDDFLFLQDYFYQEHRQQVTADADTAKAAKDEAEKQERIEEAQQAQEQARVENEKREQEAIAKQMEAIMGDKADNGAPAPPTAPADQETKDQDDAKGDDTAAAAETLSIGGQPADAPQDRPAAPLSVSGAATGDVESPEPREPGSDGQPGSPLVPPEPPPSSPMMTAYKERLAAFSQDWSAVRGLAEPHNGPEPIVLALDKVSRAGTTLLAIVNDRMKRNFKQQAQDLSSADELEHEFGEVDDEVEEDDVDEGEEAAEEVREEESEEAEGARADLKKLYGETGKFCPVMFAQFGVTQPGLAEFAVGYRGQLYLTSSQEAMDALLAEPERYIPLHSCPAPPPLRLVLLGAFGSGKSGRGHKLAEDCGVFFIDFHERLQELMQQLGRPRTGARLKTDVAGEETIEDDIQDVLAETAHMRDEFEQRKAERREERAAQSGQDLSSPASTPPPAPAAAPAAPAAAAAASSVDSSPVEPESDSAEDAEAAARRQEQAGWTAWQMEVEAHLRGEVPSLSPETLDEIVREWWEKDPFKSTGFVLEGFPATPDDLQYLTERHLFPDAFVVLATDPEQIVQRLLAGRMEQWQTKMDGFQAKLKEAREAQASERRREMEERQTELLDEIEAKKKRREERMLRQAAEAEEGEEEEDPTEDEPPEGSDLNTLADEGGEEEEEVDVEQIIADEFPEIEDSELTWETKEEASERISDILRQWHEEDTQAIDSVAEAAKEANIPWLEVDGRRRGHIVDFKLASAVEKYTKYRSSLMHRAYPIGTNMAARLLDVGYRQLSKFGKQCPVTLHERGMMMPPFNPIQRRPYPVIFRRHVYYCVDSAALAKFVRSPTLYTAQRAPLYLIPSRVAVLGPPKSGKTAVCCGLAARYGLQRVSAGEAVRGLLARWPPVRLAERLRRLLEDGQPAPEPLLVQAVQMALLSVPAQVHGYVLDGWPQSERQAQALTAAGVLPYLVLELRAAAATTVRRARRQENWFRSEQARQEAAATRRRPPPDEPRLEQPLAHCVRLASWRQAAEQLGQQYGRLHGNLAELDADGSLWSVEHAGREALENRLRDIYRYRECVAAGRAAPVGALCITPGELEVRLGPYGHYCPVCWRQGRLQDLSADRRLEHAVELQQRFYRTCGPEHQALLLADAEEYVPPRAAPLPPDLPRRLTAMDTASLEPAVALAFGGFCTVSYVSGGRCYEALVPGSEAIAAGYQQQVYRFASEEARDKFMQEPHRYYACELPKKLPPTPAEADAAAAAAAPLDIGRLPIPGYLEQALAYQLVRAVTATASRRPKHPRLCVTASALVHVALVLKGRAAAAECQRSRLAERLAEFEAGCRLVDRLGRAALRTVSDPRRLPAELRADMDRFTELLSRPRETVYRGSY